MKNFKELIKEVDFTLNSFILLNSVLTSIILFLFFYLFLVLFNLDSVVFALIPAVIYLAASIMIKIKKNKAGIIGNEYSWLNEKIKTAFDYKNADNPIINELQMEVIEDMQKVETASFINTKKTSTKLMAIVALCFMIMIAAFLNFKIIDMTAGLPGEKKLTNGQEFGVGGIGEGDGGSELIAGGGANKDIYDEASAVKLGEEEINIELKPINFEVNVNNIKDAPKRKFKETFPKDSFVESTSVYDDKIPKDQQELVKNYFKKIVND